MSNQKLNGLPVWAVVKIACACCSKPVGQVPGVFCEACERQAKRLGLK